MEVRFGSLQNRRRLLVKKYTIIFLGILLAGSVAIYLPCFISDYNKVKEAETVKNRNENMTNRLKTIESNKDTIEQQEISFDELEKGQVDSSQVFFKNVEVIYNYLTFMQADHVKKKLQFYILNTLNNVKECSIKTDTLQVNNREFSFVVEVNNYKDITVKMLKDDNGNVIDVSILQSR
jgi:hypothetical protein